MLINSGIEFNSQRSDGTGGGRQLRGVLPLGAGGRSAGARSRAEATEATQAYAHPETS